MARDSCGPATTLADGDVFCIDKPIFLVLASDWPSSAKSEHGVSHMSGCYLGYCRRFALRPSRSRPGLFLGDGSALRTRRCLGDAWHGHNSKSLLECYQTPPFVRRPG